VVQATTDETMLVRRAGILQWVPVVAAAVVIQQTLSSDFALSVIDIGGIATT
jgi:hypothetical protein